jgi:ribonuclease BN (tRNA processing enzyme)
MMKLVLLGTTGYHPNDQRQTACLMLPQIGVILDAGTAMYRARRWLETNELDIFLTHAHLDHVVGLTYLLDVLRDKPMRRTTVHGEADKLQAIEEHLFAEALFPVKPPCEFRPLRPVEPLAGPGGGRLTHFPLEHPGGTVGFRLEWPGHALAYVTDTTARAQASYLEAIRGVDLLIHECYFPDAKAELAKLTGHSVTSEVAQLAEAAGVGRLVLVHVDPSAEEADPVDLAVARTIFPETELGFDGMELEF